nr:Rid family hydrolase [uncultured Pseudoxanthomonas sp.]
MLNRSVENFGMPWERAFGYCQAVRVGQTIYLSGQLAHDQQGNLIGPAVLDDQGRIIDGSNSAIQMKATYANAAALLGRYGLTLSNVVEETIYAVDFVAAFAAAGDIRRAAYESDWPQCASTMVGTTRLALPEQLIEISMTAIVPD